MVDLQLPFGFTITRKKSEQNQEAKSLEHEVSFVPPDNDDGSLVINTGGAYYGASFVDMDGAVKSETELINKYRELALQPEVESAVDEISNEAIAKDEEGTIVKIDLDKIEIGDDVKEIITQEFAKILKLLDFNNQGYSIFRRWYVDGRLYYHAIVNDVTPLDGIKEIRYIDPRRIRKVREIESGTDLKTGLKIIKSIKEYFLYNELGAIGYTTQSMGVKIATDAIVTVNSDLMDPKRIMVLSYLNKVIKIMNMLRMAEDAMAINRLARAPERRIFYIDTSGLPRAKADQYLKDVASKYRNKLAFNQSTGELQDARQFLSVLEDYWIPTHNGKNSADISTLPGADNLNDIADIQYLKERLYRALGVPIGRLEPQGGFSLGRSTEITREEIKFAKFIDRLQSRFNILFLELLKLQLISKNVMGLNDWKAIKQDINFIYSKDNNFEEIKETELIMNRLLVAQSAILFQGTYFSQNWIKKKIFRFSDDEIELMAQEIDAENAVAQQAMANMPVPVDPNAPPPTNPQMIQPMGGQPGQPQAPQQPQAPTLPDRFVITQDTLEHHTGG